MDPDCHQQALTFSRRSRKFTFTILESQLTTSLWLSIMIIIISQSCSVYLCIALNMMMVAMNKQLDVYLNEGSMFFNSTFELQLHPLGVLSVMESHNHSRQVDPQSTQHHDHRQAPQTRYYNRRVPEERLSVRQEGQSYDKDQIMHASGRVSTAS